MDNRIRIHMSDDLNYSIIDDFNVIIGEGSGHYASYEEFLEALENAIEAFNCTEIDSIWLDEIIDLVEIYTNDTDHYNLRGLCGIIE